MREVNRYPWWLLKTLCTLTPEISIHGLEGDIPPPPILVLGRPLPLTAIVTDGNMLSHRHLGAKKEKKKKRRLGKTEIVVQDISLLRNKSRGNSSWVLSSPLSPQFKEPRKVLRGKAKVPGGIFSVAVRMAFPSPRRRAQRQHGPSSTLGERWPLSVRAFTWSDQPTALKQCVQWNTLWGRFHVALLSVGSRQDNSRQARFYSCWFSKVQILWPVLPRQPKVCIKGGHTYCHFFSGSFYVRQRLGEELSHYLREEHK